jgi:hypothetical protein
MVRGMMMNRISLDNFMRTGIAIDYSSLYLTSTALQSINYLLLNIIKELDPMIRILFKLSSMTQIEKDSFTFKLISYKNYDPYKWYKEIVNGIKV